MCSAALTNGQKVALHYKLTNGETDELIDDTSTRGQAVEITLGSGELFPKLEAQLLTCEVGSKVKLTLEPEDTYGNFDEKKIQKQPILPEEMVQVKEQVQPGQDALEGRTTWVCFPASPKCGGRLTAPLLPDGSAKQ